MSFDHVWFWNPRMGESSRKGKLCRVVTRGKRNSVMVELEDGEIVIASRYAIRKVPSVPKQLTIAEVYGEITS